MAIINLIWIRMLLVLVLLFMWVGPLMSETRTEWATRIFDRIYAENRELILMGKGVLFVIDPAPTQNQPAYVVAPKYCAAWEVSCKEQLYHSLVLQKNLVDHIPSEEMLVFVIYHELSHIFLDHSAARMRLVEHHFTGECGNSTCDPDAYRNDMNDLVEAQEREADGQAISIMAVAGLDGRAGADFLNWVHRYWPQGPSQWDLPRDRARYISNCLTQDECDLLSLQPRL